MNDNTFASHLAFTFTDIPIKIELKRKDVSLLHRVLILLKIKSPVISYQFKPITVGNFYRIAFKASTIPEDMFSEGVISGALANGYKCLEHYLYCIAVGLTNSKKEPSKKLIDQLRNQLTWDDALSLFLCVAKS